MACVGLERSLQSSPMRISMGCGTSFDAPGVALLGGEVPVAVLFLF